jgi:RNA polymerase sigma factor (TIGR02999 family)
LVHEAYLRLVDRDRVSWKDRAHFFGAAAAIMRRVLTDHARTRLSAKRGGAAIRLALDDGLGVTDRYAELLHIHECLEQLAKMDKRQSRIVELRFFGGLSIEETAEVEGISPMTVKREWAVARAWLLHHLGTAASSSSGES